MCRTKSIPKTFKTKDLPEERVCLCEMSTAAAGVELTVAEHGAAAALPVPGNAKEEAPPKDFPVPAAGPEAAGKSKGPPPLPYFQLFRYATAWDHFILAVGVLMSVSAKWWLSPEAVVFVVFFVFYCFVLFCFGFLCRGAHFGWMWMWRVCERLLRVLGFVGVCVEDGVLLQRQRMTGQ